MSQVAIKNLTEEEFAEWYGEGAEEKLKDSKTTMSIDEHAQIYIPDFALEHPFNYVPKHAYIYPLPPPKAIEEFIEELDQAELLKVLFYYTFEAEKQLSLYEGLELQKLIFISNIKAHPRKNKKDQAKKIYEIIELLKEVFILDLEDNSEIKKIYIPVEFKEYITKAKNYLLAKYGPYPEFELSHTKFLIKKMQKIIFWCHDKSD